MNSLSIGSCNGLSPGRRLAITYINAGLLSVGHLGRKFSDILITIQNFSFKRMYLKTLSAKWWPFFPGGIGTIFSDRDQCEYVIILIVWWQLGTIFSDRNQPQYVIMLLVCSTVTTVLQVGDNIKWQEPMWVHDHINSMLHCGNNVDSRGQYSVTGTSVSAWL